MQLQPITTDAEFFKLNEKLEVLKARLRANKQALSEWEREREGKRPADRVSAAEKLVNDPSAAICATDAQDTRADQERRFADLRVERRAIEEALPHVENEVRTIRFKLSRVATEKLVVEHRELARRLANAVAELGRAALAEAQLRASLGEAGYVSGLQPAGVVGGPVPLLATLAGFVGLKILTESERAKLAEPLEEWRVLLAMGQA